HEGGPLLPLAHRDHPAPVPGGRLRVGLGVLHQYGASRGRGAVSARGGLPRPAGAARPRRLSVPRTRVTSFLPLTAARTGHRSSRTDFSSWHRTVRNPPESAG